MNERILIIKFLIKEHNKKNDENDINECAKIWEILEKNIKCKNIQNIEKNYMEYLKKFFNDINNKDLLIKIFTQEIYEYFISEIKEKEKNIENNEEENLKKNIINGIQDIEGDGNNSTDENGEEVSQSPEKTLKLEIVESKTNYLHESVNKISYISQIQNDSLSFDESDFYILTHIKKIKKHKHSAEFIKETENGYFISGGGDNNLFIYNPEFEYINKIDKNEIFTNISELKNTVQNDIIKKDINLIASTKKDTYSITFNTYKNDVKIQNITIPNISNFSSCVEIRKNNHLICGDKGLFYATDLFSKIITTKSQNINKTKYKGGLKINKNFIAITSNKIVNGEKNILEFYNANSQRIIKTIKNYSFISSTNGLALMPREETKSEESKSEYRYLLCACKKYESNKMNGILIVSDQIESKLEIKKPFYNTGNFEVYCFCPLLYKERQSYKKLLDDYKFLKSDYFLVGGYDPMKGKGIIKLFKLNHKENIEDTTIEFIQDIDIEQSKDFNGFKRPITCIIQSKKNGKILVSCWDGNIHLFSCPNIYQFIKYEETTKNDIMEILEINDVISI